MREHRRAKQSGNIENVFGGMRGQEQQVRNHLSVQHHVGWMLDIRH